MNPRRFLCILFSGALLVLSAGFFFTLAAEPLSAEPLATASGLQISLDLGGDDANLVPVLKIALFLLLLSLLPAILISMTSFMRILIVLAFLKQALGTQTLPPTQVIIGLSLFLCLFTMSPVIGEIHQGAFIPYQNGELNDFEAFDEAMNTMRHFMARHTRPQDLELFVSLVHDERPASFDEVSTLTLIPAFMLSELRTAFIMGALIFLPFIIIDIVVASVLMAMGMMMVPPVMVSLPIKLLLFVLADGWNLVVSSLVRSLMI